MSEALTMQLIFGGMIGLFIVVVAVPLIIFLRSTLKATATNRWPSVEGRVLSSEVTSHRSLNSNGTHTTIYTPKVVYEYAVSGQPYRGEQVSYSAVDGTSMGGFAEEIVSKYPAGSAVRVFYDPAQPGEAVLEHNGAGGNLALALIMGVVELILIGICVGIVMAR